METPKILIMYNGSNLYAFKDAPGWYVYQWQLLGQVGGELDGKQITINAHGYKIIAGPFETEAQAQQFEAIS